jgi:Flp pilus assembly protein TadG
LTLIRGKGRGPTGGSNGRRDRQSGQALLELALVAPVIILLLMGLVQFALIWERQIGIINAVRDTARITATFPVGNIVEAGQNADWAMTKLDNLLAANVQNYETSRDDIEICIFQPSDEPNDVSGIPQVSVRIRMTYEHPLWLPLITQILDPLDGFTDQSLAASTESEFHVEQDDSVAQAIGIGDWARTDPGNTADCART